MSCNYQLPVSENKRMQQKDDAFVKSVPVTGWCTFFVLDTSKLRFLRKAFVDGG